MKLFKKQLNFDFDNANWDVDPALFIMHHILENREDLILLFQPCFANAKAETTGVVGRDGMTLEQVVRCTIYKQHNRLTYAELSRAAADSKLGRTFMKMGLRKQFSPQTLQENISKITPEALAAFDRALTLFALDLDVDSGKKVRPDSTVIKTNIHYPTNASLLWDGVRVSCRLLLQAKALLHEIRFRSYRKAGKKLFFKIVNTNGKNAKQKRRPLFKRLLKAHKACENQVVEAAAALSDCIMSDEIEERKRQRLLRKLQTLLPKMQQVGDVARRCEIDEEQVPVAEKLFSIFEDHTDCICKGGKKPFFGHKVNLTVGESQLIFDCIIERGNPADVELYPKTIDNLQENLSIVPDSIASDGGFASLKNRDYALAKGVKNVVFNKVRGALKNVASSKKMETMLKKWRAGVEAAISNFKRGLNAGTCTWKGWQAFQKFVLWNVIVFNLRVIARFVVKNMN